MPESAEILNAVVERVTYHNEETGWSVLRVTPVGRLSDPIVVTAHQVKIFPGSTLEFTGKWMHHSKFGRQFKAFSVVEKKPATSAALEKYLGSGLIKGVGPKTATRIVRHFGKDTLEVFENEIDKLLEVPGIAKKKLEQIREAWYEHSAIRDVMIFLQSHGISTLFAVRIFKEYGDKAIAYVSANPYRLDHDFYGIGFLTADKVALSLGMTKDSPQRIMAGIRHVLAGSREFGHCYLTEKQIASQVHELVQVPVQREMPAFLLELERAGDLKTRQLLDELKNPFTCFYSKSLYYAETLVAGKVQKMCCPIPIDSENVAKNLAQISKKEDVQLSEEQAASVLGILGQKFSILTGGPGCGKTTTTKALTTMLRLLDYSIALAAPTGRAAQRMGEVIGSEAKTIHRLLEWQRGQFKKCSDNHLEADFLIVDECSMLDILLTAALVDAVPETCQVLFIGDPDQLPSVGAGNVLRDLLACKNVPHFTLSKVFRQAQKSHIIRYAHQINHGKIPHVESPFFKPEVWQGQSDCLFIDSEEATQEQLRFIARAKKHPVLFEPLVSESKERGGMAALYEFQTKEANKSPYETDFIVPKKYQHVDFDKLKNASTLAEELKAVVKKLHPWSALNYGLTAAQVIEKLYLEWIPKYYGKECEIQILSPMTRGSLGTARINELIQAKANPSCLGKAEMKISEKIFRVGDRIIHRKNNYDLGVFNGDIGSIVSINNETMSCTVQFSNDGRQVVYAKEDLMEIEHAFCITIHKSQGSEFEVVVIPILTQHFRMLYRNLIYTGLTRARKLAVFVGTRRAMALAVKNVDTALRQTALKNLVEESAPFCVA